MICSATPSVTQRRGSLCQALSGLGSVIRHTQGVALGWYVAPLRGLSGARLGEIRCLSANALASRPDTASARRRILAMRATRGIGLDSDARNRRAVSAANLGDGFSLSKCVSARSISSRSFSSSEISSCGSDPLVAMLYLYFDLECRTKSRRTLYLITRRVASSESRILVAVTSLGAPRCARL